MSSPIADMLTSIRNALAVKKAEVMIPFSNMKMEILKILKEYDYIDSFEIATGNVRNDAKLINIKLKYKPSKLPMITGLKIVSKPGQRRYVSKDEIPKVLNNLGIAIISTSQGIMTGEEARKRKLGGEIICEVY